MALSNGNDKDSEYTRSAKDNGYVSDRKIAKLLNGSKLVDITNKIYEVYNIYEKYTHVKAFDLPEYDNAFNYYLVNFYYEQEKNPQTYLDCYRVYLSGKVERT